MLEFLRSATISRAEPEDELTGRLREAWGDMRELLQKQPEEVAGEPLESVYYALRLAEALESNDEKQALLYLSEMLRVSPLEGFHRVSASAAYEQFCNESEAIAQLGIALALDPGMYLAHERLARLLIRRGERKAAKAVMENGWIYRSKHVAEADLDSERADYFKVLNEEQSA